MEVSLDHAPALSRFPQAEWDEDAGALVVQPEDAREVVEWLRDDPAYGLDYLSNVTGVDYLETEKKERREKQSNCWRWGGGLVSSSSGMPTGAGIGLSS